MDLVTICFSKELLFLKLQARSIDKFAPSELVDNYYIVINEQNPEVCERFIIDEIQPSLTWLASRVVLLSCKDFGFNTSQSGWRSQQAIKLLVSNYIKSTYYLMLDAKNHFVRNVFISDFFSTEGKPRARLKMLKDSDKQKKWLANSYSFFGLKLPLGEIASGVTITPYVLVTSVVRELVETIQDMGKNVADVFLSEKSGRPTEFFLYYAFISHKKLSYDQVYSCTMSPQSTIFSTYPRTDAQFKSIIENVSEPGCFMFAIHRARLSSLTVDQKMQVRNLWLSLNLLGASEVEDIFKCALE